MNIEIKGVITDIFDTETIRNFEKRIFWLAQTGVEFPNDYQLECHQNDVNRLDDFNPGELVNCFVSVRGKAFNKKSNGEKIIINTLKCWKIERVGENKPTPSNRNQTGGKGAKSVDQEHPKTIADEDDSLPF